MRSAPAALNAFAISTASCGVIPPSVQSWAEIRTLIGLPTGQTSRTAVKISSGYFIRFSREPPYSSLRRFVMGEINDESKYP